MCIVEVMFGVFSVHGPKVCMLPNFYLRFSVRFYQISNLKLFMPIYHYADTIATAIFSVYYSFL